MKFTNLKSKQALAIAALLFGVAVMNVLVLMPNSAQTVTSMQPLGTVLEFKNCESGKRTLNCAVRTTTHAWNTDVTGWPGDIIQQGDVLALRVDDTGSRREQWICRNGTCRSQSLCWSWMPCWTKK